VELARFDPESPLSVGNGEFAFTVDATGLQTIPEEYEKTIPLGTLSQWGWHTWPNPRGWRVDTFAFRECESHGRMVGYADIPGERTPEIDWLRANPHRLHLERIGFRLTRADGARAAAADLADIRQTLDLWNGVITSHFRFEGETVAVETTRHPSLDAVSVRVRSKLLRTGRVAIAISFPYGTGQVTAADWTRPEAHRTEVTQLGPGQARFARTLDADTHHASARWSTGAAAEPAGPHTFLLAAAPGTDALTATVVFAPAQLTAPAPSFEDTRAAARTHWNRFWSTGGAIDLSGSQYPFAETAPDTYSNRRWATDHPSVVAMLGVLPGAGVDREVMTRTFDWVWAHWDWPSTWGWDYPMMAMTAARLGKPDRAVDTLLMDTPTNGYRFMTSRPAATPVRARTTRTAPGFSAVQPRPRTSPAASARACCRRASRPRTARASRHPARRRCCATASSARSAGGPRRMPARCRPASR
jgi:hypothetical protein